MHHIETMPDEILTGSYSIPPTRRRRFAPEPGEVRCECSICGSHAFADPAVQGSGRCGNCGSLELQPIEVTA